MVFAGRNSLGLDHRLPNGLHPPDGNVCLHVLLGLNKQDALDVFYKGSQDVLVKTSNPETSYRARAERKVIAC